MEIHSIDMFLKYYERIRERSRRIIEAIPKRMDWRPSKGQFSFADLIRHIAAIERYMFACRISSDRGLLCKRHPSPDRACTEVPWRVSSATLA